MENAQPVCDALLVRVTLLLLGAALGVLAYRVQVHDLRTTGDHAAATVAVGYAFLAAGLVAWTRRPANRLGPLMVVAAFALLARQLRYSNNAVFFTTFFALGELSYALVGHSVLAYPFGHVRGRVERWLVRAGYATALVFPLAVLLAYEGGRPLIQFTGPRDSVVDIVPSDDLAILVQKVEVVAFYGILGTCFIAVIVRNLVWAAPRMRRVLAPLLVAAITIALRAVWESVFTFVDRKVASESLFWWEIGALIALPLALLAGLLRAKLARAAVADLLLQLERVSVPGLRDALARTLGDPTLQLAFALPGGHAFVDAGGAQVELPTADPRRAVTRLDHDGESVAALVHDPSLLEEPELVEAAGAAARLALENAQLQAELRVHLQEVEASRARLVDAADEERRRIERDLHDGLQQSLMAIAIRLTDAHRQGGGRLDVELERTLKSSVSDLKSALQELRELAHGLHPTILAEGGLAAALDGLASRSGLLVTVDATQERFAPEIELTAYFVASEALANVAKHAQASAVEIGVRRENGTLRIEVVDDGVGGARLTGGTGLRGLADRIEARGGTLHLESPRGGGTRVVGAIPCGS